jgi:hypothetical protein
VNEAAELGRDARRDCDVMSDALVQHPRRHSGAARSDEPGIHNHDREYGFRARDYVAPRNDDAEMIIRYHLDVHGRQSLSGQQRNSKVAR